MAKKASSIFSPSLTISKNFFHFPKTNSRTLDTGYWVQIFSEKTFNNTHKNKYQILIPSNFILV
jgi:hypothetical protein